MPSPVPVRSDTHGRAYSAGRQRMDSSSSSPLTLSSSDSRLREKIDESAICSDDDTEDTKAG